MATEKVMVWDDATQKFKEKSIVVGPTMEFVSHDGVNTVVGAEGSVISTINAALTIVFANTIQPTDFIVPEISINGIVWTILDNKMASGSVVLTPTVDPKSMIISISNILTDITPAMTSGSAPAGYVANASGYLGSGYDPYLAFDHSSATDSKWVIPGISGWLSFKFPSTRLATQYRITPHENPSYVNQSPKNWTVEGWDGFTWTVLDTRSNITDWVANTGKLFTATSPGLYDDYRINVSQNNGGTNLTIRELELFESVRWRVRKISY